jgi:hypothetical protein
MKEDFLTAHEWFMHDQAQWWEEFKQQEEARRMAIEGEWKQLEFVFEYAESAESAERHPF